MPMRIEYEDTFLMSPKNDFAFKRLFGDERNKNILKALLKSVLKLPDDELDDIELVNTELKKEYIEDRKAILDVMVKTKNGVHIDVEIQVLETNYMFERAIFYWGKMYIEQLKSGEGFKKLKKAIAINIIDFNCMPTDKYCSSLRLVDNDTGANPTDVLLIYFLELKKLPPLDKADLDDKLIQWMMFIGADKKEVLDMLSEKNVDIEKAYEVLKVLSGNKEERALYEAREKALHDEATRIDSAYENGVKDVARNMLIEGFGIELVAKISGLPIEEVIELSKDLS